jgi:hypothetical protein
MTDNPHYVTPDESADRGCVMSMARQNPNIVYQMCIGPQCMAWRWITNFEYNENTYKLEEKFSTTHGSCGMVRS